MFLPFLIISLAAWLLALSIGIWVARCVFVVGIVLYSTANSAKTAAKIF
jgi:hypothetical protein